MKRAVAFFLALALALPSPAYSLEPLKTQNSALALAALRSELRGVMIPTADLTPEEELENLRAFLTELKKEESLPGAGRWPKVAMISDPHGTIEKFDALIADSLRSALPPGELPAGFKLDPGQSLEDQLAHHGISLEDFRGKLYFHNLGDFMDRGPKGVKVFRRSRDLIDAGLSDFIIGNHDLWEFMNLQGFHLPWYPGYNFYGYTDDYDHSHGNVKDLVDRYQREIPETRTKTWWAERLAEFTAEQAKKQKEKWNELDLRIKGEKPGAGLFAQVSAGLTAEQKKLWDKFRGWYLIDIYTGTRAAGTVSIKWWQDLLREFKQAFSEVQASSHFDPDSPPNQAWRQAIRMMEEEILPELKKDLEAHLEKGEWWRRVFEAINYQNYTSTEWWAKDWIFHKDWGPSVLEELNEEAKGKAEPVTAANYFENRTLGQIADFFRSHFTLYLRDAYQNVYMHAFLPIDTRTGEFFFAYKGREYRGRGNEEHPSVWEGLDRIARAIQDPAHSMSDLYEELSLVNRWYADNTTAAKVPSVAEAINKFGARKLAKVNGFNRLFTAHIPFHEFSRLSPEKRGVIAGFQTDHIVIFTDHGMGTRFGYRGGRVDISPDGISLRGFEKADSDVIISNPRTVETAQGPDGAVEKVLFENPGIPREKFLPQLISDVERRLTELQAELRSEARSKKEGVVHGLHVPTLEPADEHFRKLSLGAWMRLYNLLDDNGRAKILALDQSGSMKKLLREKHKKAGGDFDKLEKSQQDKELIDLKLLLSQILSTQASAVLHDVQHGIAVAGLFPGGISPGASLIGRIEKSVDPGKPALTEPGWSVRDLVVKANGQGAKILVYLDLPLSEAEAKADPERVRIAQEQLDYMRKVYRETRQWQIPLLAEELVYERPGEKKGARDYEIRKAETVILAAQLMSPMTDILKLEFPGDFKTMSEEEIRNHLARLKESAKRPWVLLSAGEDYETFRQKAEWAMKYGGAIGVMSGRAYFKEISNYQLTSDQVKFLEKTAVSRMREINEIVDRHAQTIWQAAGVWPEELRSKVFKDYAPGWHAQGKKVAAPPEASAPPAPGSPENPYRSEARSEMEIERERILGILETSLWQAGDQLSRLNETLKDEAIANAIDLLRIFLRGIQGEKDSWGWYGTRDSIDFYQAPLKDAVLSVLDQEKYRALVPADVYTALETVQMGFTRLDDIGKKLRAQARKVPFIGGPTPPSPRRGMERFLDDAGGRSEARDLNRNAVESIARINGAVDATPSVVRSRLRPTVRILPTSIPVNSYGGRGNRTQSPEGNSESQSEPPTRTVAPSAGAAHLTQGQGSASLPISQEKISYNKITSRSEARKKEELELAVKGTRVVAGHRITLKGIKKGAAKFLVEEPQAGRSEARMLVLSRHRHESIVIGDDIVITVIDIQDDKVRIGIQAPVQIPVHRQEVYEAIQRENRMAAQQRAEQAAKQPEKKEPGQSGPPSATKPGGPAMPSGGRSEARRLPLIGSEESQKVGDGDLGRAEDALKGPAVNFPVVRNDEGNAAKRVSQLDVASSLADLKKPAALQGRNDLAAGNERGLGHIIKRALGLDGFWRGGLPSDQVQGKAQSPRGYSSGLLPSSSPGSNNRGAKGPRQRYTHLPPFREQLLSSSGSTSRNKLNVENEPSQARRSEVRSVVKMDRIAEAVKQVILERGKSLKRPEDELIIRYRDSSQDVGVILGRFSYWHKIVLKGSAEEALAKAETVAQELGGKVEEEVRRGKPGFQVDYEVSVVGRNIMTTKISRSEARTDSKQAFLEQLGRQISQSEVFKALSVSAEQIVLDGAPPSVYEEVARILADGDSFRIEFSTKPVIARQVLKKPTVSAGGALERYHLTNFRIIREKPARRSEARSEIEASVSKLGDLEIRREDKTVARVEAALFKVDPNPTPENVNEVSQSFNRLAEALGEAFRSAGFSEKELKVAFQITTHASLLVSVREAAFWAVPLKIEPLAQRLNAEEFAEVNLWRRLKETILKEGERLARENDELRIRYRESPEDIGTIVARSINLRLADMTDPIAEELVDRSIRNFHQRAAFDSEAAYEVEAIGPNIVVTKKSPRSEARAELEEEVDSVQRLGSQLNPAHPKESDLAYYLGRVYGFITRHQVEDGLAVFDEFSRDLRANYNSRGERKFQEIRRELEKVLSGAPRSEAREEFSGRDGDGVAPTSSRGRSREPLGQPQGGKLYPSSSYSPSRRSEARTEVETGEVDWDHLAERVDRKAEEIGRYTVAQQLLQVVDEQGEILATQNVSQRGQLGSKQKLGEKVTKVLEKTIKDSSGNSIADQYRYSVSSSSRENKIIIGRAVVPKEFSGDGELRSEARLAKEGIQKTLGAIWNALEGPRPASDENALARRIVSLEGISSHDGLLIDPDLLLRERYAVFALGIRKFFGASVPVAVATADPKVIAALNEVNDFLAAQKEEPFLVTATEERAAQLLKEKFKVKRLRAILSRNSNSTLMEKIHGAFRNIEVVTEGQLQNLFSQSPVLAGLAGDLQHYFALAESA